MVNSLLGSKKLIAFQGVLQSEKTQVVKDDPVQVDFEANLTRRSKSYFRLDGSELNSGGLSGFRFLQPGFVWRPGRLSRTQHSGQEVAFKNG